MLEPRRVPWKERRKETNKRTVRAIIINYAKRVKLHVVPILEFKFINEEFTTYY